MKGQIIKDAGGNNTDTTVIFACKRSGILAVKTAGVKSGYEIIPIECACSLDSREVIDRYVSGAERIMIISCHPDNCRSIHGDTSARLKIKRICAETGISPSMLSLHSIAANEPAKFKTLAEGSAGNEKENSDE